MSGKSIKRLFQAVTSFVLAGSMVIPNGISVFAETADDQSVTSVSVPVTITTDSGEGPDAVTVRLNSDNELAYTQLTKENGYSGSFTVNKSDLMDDAGNAKTLTVGADAADGYSIEVTAQPEVTVTPVTELAAQISSEAQTVNEELVTDGYNLAVGVNESGAYILTDAELSEEAKATLLSNTAAATGITSVMGFITGLDLHEYATAYLGTYEYLTHYEVTVSEAKLKMERVRVASYSQKKRNNSILSSDSLENYKATPSQGTASAQFFYLKNPTCDPKSNNPSDWGKTLGNGMLYTDGLWSSDTQRNAYTDRNGHDISNRVAKWPDNSTGITYTVPNGEHWTAIFNSYKSSISTSLGVSIAEGDVESIVLHPYKISRFNGSKPDLHMDCTVEIKCKQVVTATYMLNDTDGSGYQFAEAYNYIAGRDSTSPQNDYPLLKTVNTTTYVFSGWYTNSELTGSPVTFPYTMGSENITFYAAYKPLNVTVTTTGGEFTYDGQTHGATVTVEGLPSGYTYEASSNDNATHVADGTVTATCDTLIIRNAEGVDVTSELKIKYVNDSITITPATLTVTTPSASKVYDGTALTAAGTITGFVNEETATFTTTGSIINTGNKPNTYSLDFNKTAAESDYTVSKSIGTLTVTEYAGEITVTTTGGEFTYDGEAHGATVSVSSLPKGYTLDTATSNATATHVAKGPVTATCNTLVIKNMSDVDVTKKLNIKYVNGLIKINPATLTVTTESASKVYDGDPLTAGGAISGFVKNETATFTVTGSQTEVDSSKNTYSLDFNKTAAESDYTVSESIGTLTVTQYADEIVVTTTGGTFTYDGKAHGATVSVSSLPKGYTLDTATSNATATHVADGTVTATCDTLIIRNAEGVDVTSELKIKYVNDSITITPATLTVITPSASKVYDGTALTAAGTITGFANGETATFTTTGSQTEADSSKNTYSLDFNKTAAESDYTVSESIGTLTVTRQSIIPDQQDPDAYKGVTVDDPQNHVYDGQVHKFVPQVKDALKNELVEDKDYTVSYDTENFTDVQTITVTIEGINNYKGTVEKKYQITPREVIITTPTAAKVYDAKPLTAEGLMTGLVEGETVSFITTGTQTEVGTSDNTYILEWTGSAKKSNYTIKDTKGKLTVVPQSIDPESSHYLNAEVNDPENFKYDGKEHIFQPIVTDAKGNELVEGTDYTVSYDTENFTDVHTITVTVTGIGNYEGTVKKTYDITRRNVILESATASKVFDGNPLTDETVTVNGDGFVKGDAEYAATGTITEVGTTENPIELTFADEKIAERILALFSTETYSLRDNYTIEMKFGTLTVTPKAIDPEDPDTDDEKRIVVEKPEDSVYDGEEHVNRPVIKDPETGEILEEGKDYELTYPDDVTNAGEKTVIVEGKGNYEGEFEVAYEITPRPITVKADDASKAEGRKDPEFTAQLSEELIEGNEIVYELNREEGEEAGEYAIHPTGAIKQGNYIVSYADGTLTINRAPETPVTNDKPRPQTPMTPNTSDSTNIVMYAGFAIAALIAILGVIILRKKEN